MRSPSHPPINAALLALIALQSTMLLALFAGVAPHPPATTPLSGMGPFIGSALAAALGALAVGTDTKAGRALSALAATMALLSFGPQKYRDPEIALIWPAVVGGQIAILTVFVSVGRRVMGTQGGTRLLPVI